MGAWEQRRKLGSKPVRGLAHKLYYIFGPEHALPRQGLGFRFGWDGRAQEKQFVRPASPQKRQPPDDSIFNCIFDEGLSENHLSTSDVCVSFHIPFPTVVPFPFPFPLHVMYPQHPRCHRSIQHVSFVVPWLLVAALCLLCSLLSPACSLAAPGRIWADTFHFDCNPIYILLLCVTSARPRNLGLPGGLLFETANLD